MKRSKGVNEKKIWVGMKEEKERKDRRKDGKGQKN